MSLEQQLADNTAATLALSADIKNLLAEMRGGKSAAAPAADAPASEKKGPGRPKKEDAAPKVSFEEMKTALLKVKDEKGKEAAASIIKTVGGAEKMDGIKPEKFAAVLAAAEAALASSDEGGSDDDGL